MITDDHKKTVLQFLLVERMMTYSEFTDMVVKVVGVNKFSVDALVESLNERIRRFSQKIVTTNSESTGEKVVVLVSTADNADIKSAMTKDQIDFFYYLMDEIITNSGCTYNAALNSAPRATSGRMTILEGEKVLEYFIRKKLLVHENGFVFVSPLTVIELGSYITQTYSPPLCILCKKLRVTGGQCFHCEAPIHSHCSVQYVTNNKGKARCPQCKESWSTGV